MRPDQPDALHMLGVVCHCLGRSREAATLIRKAGEVTGWRFATMQHNYALALGSRMLGRSIGQTARLRSTTIAGSRDASATPTPSTAIRS
jgi:hypothetical protein